MARETGDLAGVLAANAAFYMAFAARDVATMDRLWAERHPVACVHPGWPPLLGREAVMESWQRILANPAAPKIRCFHERALIYGTVALVICHEILQAGLLVATNTFVREGGLWRLAHHQSSPVAEGALVTEEASSPLKN